MFGCFFSHKFERVSEDGHQYCQRCGFATRPAIPATPHPCANGHMWVDEYTQQYQTRRMNGLTGAQTFAVQIQYFQECSVCKQKRDITVGESA